MSKWKRRFEEEARGTLSPVSTGLSVKRSGEIEVSVVSSEYEYSLRLFLVHIVID